MKKLLTPFLLAVALVTTSFTITQKPAAQRVRYAFVTDTEWEYAARGGSKSGSFEYSGSNDLDKVGWYAGNAGGQTQSVGSKTPNELGIYDMSGNVWEWCKDWYGPYASAAQTNPKGAASGSARVLRGGSKSRDATYCRVVNRDYRSPRDPDDGNGFRVVLSQ